MDIVIAGIGTDVGKTVVSAILCEALGAEYWKPVQAGDLDFTDTDRVQQLVSHKRFRAHTEAFRLTQPMSPHAAAKIDGVVINPTNFHRPNCDAVRLVIELAGGLMVPLSESHLTIDLAAKLDAQLVLVASYYLGSINHTLLTLNLIAQKGLDLAGIIFNGKPNIETRDVILNYSRAELIAEIPNTNKIDKVFVKSHARNIRKHPRLAGL